MTDRSRDPGRIDLRTIDAPFDDARADRVIAAALSRASGGAGSLSSVLATIGTRTGPLIALAAALLLAAAASLLFTRGRAGGDQPANLVATWTEQEHVPTNGELLAAFQGYGR